MKGNVEVLNDPAYPYSAIKHVASSMWLNGNMRRFFMAMFSGYFDASGHPDGTPVLFVSGFVSTVEKWQKFEREWADLLRRYGIEGCFHMKDFAPGVRQYASWKDDKPKRKAFLAEAIKIIKRRTNKSFSSGVIIQDLAEANRLYRRPKITSFPYSLCGISVMQYANEWVNRSLKKGRAGQMDRLKMFFEDGDKHKGVFLDGTSKIGLLPLPNFLSKQECSPFQAADFLAWEHRRLAGIGVTTGEWGDWRGSFASLFKQVPNDGSWGFHDKKTLLADCEKKGYPRRK